MLINLIIRCGFYDVLSLIEPHDGGWGKTKASAGEDGV